MPGARAGSAGHRGVAPAAPADRRPSRCSSAADRETWVSSIRLAQEAADAAKLEMTAAERATFSARQLQTMVRDTGDDDA